MITILTKYEFRRRNYYAILKAGIITFLEYLNIVPKTRPSPGQKLLLGPIFLYFTLHSNFLLFSGEPESILRLVCPSRNLIRVYSQLSWTLSKGILFQRPRVCDFSLILSFD